MSKRLAGRRVAVIGAAGGIGAAVAERLAGEGARVHALDVGKFGDPPPGVEPDFIDVTSEDSVRTAPGSSRTTSRPRTCGWSCTTA